MYRKSIRTKKLEAKRERCRKMRAAKERKRMQMAEESGLTWTQFEVVLKFSVSPCKRYVAVQCGDRREVCGSERTVRAKLAKAIWRKTA